MKSIGFMISHKDNEKRRGLLPEDIANIRNKDYLYFEEGYGRALGISDQDYLESGVKVVPRSKILECDIITDVKLGDADYLDQLEDGKILFGWAHAAQGINFTDTCLRKKFTVIAWEEIFQDGRYIFYRNREVAGEAAVMQAFCHYGKMPYECKIAIIGNGQTAKGALRILHGLGAEVDVFNRKQENLFKKTFPNYDVIINCVLWDISRKDRLLYSNDLKKMKSHSMIIDVSCDPHLEIESSHPTTISNPIYEENGVIHYAVDNTPAMFPITISRILSKEISKFLDSLIEDDYPECIENAIVIKQGSIKDEKVWNFRKDKGLVVK